LDVLVGKNEKNAKGFTVTKNSLAGERVKKEPKKIHEKICFKKFVDGKKERKKSAKVKLRLNHGKTKEKSEKRTGEVYS